MEFREYILQIKALVNIVDVISSYIPVQKIGNNYRAACPFHQEKTPSFYIYSKNQNYHCFGCGATGDAIKFVQEYEKISFNDAVKKLANVAGIAEMDFHGKVDEELSRTDSIYRKICDYFQRELLSTNEAMDYILKQRGFSKDIIEEFSLGYSNDNEIPHELIKEIGKEDLIRLGVINRDNSFRYYKRLLIPIADANGRFIGIAGRILENITGVPKYINTPQTKYFNKGKILYLENKAKEHIKELKSVIIVEGYMDAIAMHSSGIKNTVAVMGTALTDYHVRRLKNHTKNIVLLFDSDNAGKDAVIRSYKALDKYVNVMVCNLSDTKDPDEFIKTKGIEAFKGELIKSTPIEDYMIDKLYEQFNFETSSGKDSYLKSVKQILKKVISMDRLSHFKELISKVSLKTGIEEQMLANWVYDRKENIFEQAKSLKITDNRKSTRTVSKDGRINTHGNNPEDYLLYIFLYRPDMRGKIRELVKDNQDNFTEGFKNYFKDCNVKFLPDDSDRVLQDYFDSKMISRVFRLDETEFFNNSSHESMMKILSDCEKALKKRSIDNTIAMLDEKIKKEIDPAKKMEMIKKRIELITNMKKNKN